MCATQPQMRPWIRTGLYVFIIITPVLAVRPQLQSIRILSSEFMYVWLNQAPLSSVDLAVFELQLFPSMLCL